jgi:RNA polymerase sigma-70 factor (ECF subfamily)
MSKETRTSTEPEIEEAIAQVQEGNLEAYRTVLTVYHRRLRNLIAGFCPPSIDGDEIVHLAFVQAYHAIGKYRRNSNFFAWLVTIARNVLRCELEKVQRRTRNEKNYLEYLLAQQLDRLAVENHETEVGSSDFFNECLALLRAEARALVELRYRDGLRVQDIAQRQGRSPDAISVQLFRLRGILRDCVTAKAAGGAPSSTD